MFTKGALRALSGWRLKLVLPAEDEEQRKEEDGEEDVAGGGFSGVHGGGLFFCKIGVFGGDCKDNLRKIKELWVFVREEE